MTSCAAELKARILSVNDRKPIPADVPEWGDGIYLRPMSGNERDEFEVWRDENAEDLTGFRAKVVAYCLCDADGQSLGFTPAEVVRLGEKNGGILDHLCTRALSLSRYTQKDIKELEGN